MAEPVARAYLGLGSNLGDRAANLDAATERLAATPEIVVAARASIWETPPWGDTDQPHYLNTALALDTRLGPHALLETCLAIETTLGRVRGRRWGARMIDIDLLHYEGVRLADARLTLPHPHLMVRAFVLAPLAEIVPDLVIEGTCVAEALAAIDRTGVERSTEATPTLSLAQPRST